MKEPQVPRKNLLTALNIFKEDIEFLEDLIDETGAHSMIFEYIKGFESVQEIDLREYYNEIKDDSYGYLLLSEALSSGLDIHKLFLPNDVNYDRLKLIIESLENNNNIRSFGFGDFSLEDSQIRKLLQFIRNNTSIEGLTLDLVNLRGINDLIPYLEPIFCSNTNHNSISTLRKLELTFTNNLNTVERIFQHLKNNINLNELILNIARRESKVRHNGVTIWCNDIITKFDIAALNSIKDNLISNLTLKTIQLNGLDIDDNFAQMLVEVIQERKKILYITFSDKVSIQEENKKNVNQAIIDKILYILSEENWQELGNDNIIEMFCQLSFLTYQNYQTSFNFSEIIGEYGEFNLLHLAVENKNKTIVDCLLERRSDPNKVTRALKNNIVHLATEAEDLNLLQSFSSDYPGLFNHSNINNKKPFHIAYEKRNDDLLAYIINHTSYTEDFCKEDFIEELIVNLMPKSIESIFKQGVKVKDRFLDCFNNLQGEKISSVKSILAAYRVIQMIIDGYITQGNVEMISQTLSKHNYTVNFASDFGQEIVGKAFKTKQFKVCAFFLSQDINNLIDYNGLTINYHENELENISTLQKHYLVSYPTSVIDSIVSKIFFKVNFDLEPFIRGFKKLLSDRVTKNQLLNPILHILKYDSALEITIDLLTENISRIYLSYEAGIKGSTLPHRSEIYIGGKRDMNVLVGTVIHEFCHHACYLLWNNGAKPYKDGDEINKQLFQNIIDELYDIESNPERTHELVETITEIFPAYAKVKYPNELIARIPQIIVTHSDQEKYFTKFDNKHPLKRLYNYYRDTFLPAIDKFISDQIDEKLNYKLNNLSIPQPNVKATPLTLEDASLSIQNFYRGYIVRKVYNDFREEEEQINKLSISLKDRGYIKSAECLLQEQAGKKSSWVEKIKQADRHSHTIR